MCDLLPGHTDDHVVGFIVQQQLSPVNLRGLFTYVVTDEGAVPAGKGLQVGEPLPQIIVLQLLLVDFDLVVLQLVLLISYALLQTGCLGEGIFGDRQGVLEVCLGSTSTNSGGVFRPILSRALAI